MSADDMSPQPAPHSGNDETPVKAVWIAPHIEIVAAADAENSPFVAGATFDGGIGYS